ncbi:unnamed protein product [Calypogeia fissa]
MGNRFAVNAQEIILDENDITSVVCRGTRGMGRCSYSKDTRISQINAERRIYGSHYGNFSSCNTRVAPNLQSMSKAVFEIHMPPVQPAVLSLACYKNHSLRCTESFMRNNVIEEMLDIQASKESQQNMLEALKRIRFDDDGRSIIEDEVMGDEDREDDDSDGRHRCLLSSSH